MKSVSRPLTGVGKPTEQSAIRVEVRRCPATLLDKRQLGNGKTPVQFVCPEGVSVYPAKGAALENSGPYAVHRANGPTVLLGENSRHWGREGRFTEIPVFQGSALRWANDWAFGPTDPPIHKQCHKKMGIAVLSRPEHSRVLFRRSVARTAPGSYS